MVSHLFAESKSAGRIYIHNSFLNRENCLGGVLLRMGRAFGFEPAILVRPERSIG
jgi:hypothetical protein